VNNEERSHISSSEHTEEKLAAFLEAQEALKDSFSTLSIEALEKNRKAFMENAEQILKGYQESAVTDLEHRRPARGQEGHGVMAVGRNPWDAFEHIERLEHICEIALKSGVEPNK